MKNKIRYILIATIIFSGCSVVKPTYIQPASGDVASLIVTINGVSIMNAQVLIHGDRICNVEDAELAALINNWNSIYEKKTSALLSIPAGKEVSISIPIPLIDQANLKQVSTEFSQPMYSFIPQLGQSYQLDFYQTHAELFSINNGIKVALDEGRLNKECQLTTKLQGNRHKLFFLIPK
jgi:hypothetical protein